MSKLNRDVVVSALSAAARVVRAASQAQTFKKLAAIWKRTGVRSEFKSEALTVPGVAAVKFTADRAEVQHGKGGSWLVIYLDPAHEKKGAARGGLSIDDVQRLYRELAEHLKSLLGAKVVLQRRGGYVTSVAVKNLPIELSLTIGLDVRYKGSLRIEFIGVPAELQGNGIATSVVDTLRVIARRLGLEQITLFADNTKFWSSYLDLPIKRKKQVQFDANTAAAVSAKYMNEKTAQCLHCHKPLLPRAVTRNPNHVYKLGIMYACACGRCKLWGNSIRDERRFVDFMSGRKDIAAGVVRYSNGFCNDRYDGVSNKPVSVIKNGVPVPGQSQEADIIGDSAKPDSRIAYWSTREDDEQDTKAIVEFYRRHFDEVLAQLSPWAKKALAAAGTPVSAFSAAVGIAKEPVLGSRTDYADRGYYVQEEQWSVDSSSPVSLRVAYSLPGDLYIGDDKTAARLHERYGITRWERAAPGDKVCSLGYSPTKAKWYGWSHRAISGFGVGHKCATGDMPEARAGFKIKNLDQARAVAGEFAKCVAHTQVNRRPAWN